MIDKLYAACVKFEKLAQINVQNIQNSLLVSTRNAILAEIDNGIRIINQLVTTDKAAANSEALTVIDEIFGKMLPYAQQMSVDSLKSDLGSLTTLAGQATFFTSKNNAGIGYDPITSKGGYNSVGAVINRIQANVKKLTAVLQSAAK